MICVRSVAHVTYPLVSVVLMAELTHTTRDPYGRGLWLYVECSDPVTCMDECKTVSVVEEET